MALLTADDVLNKKFQSVKFREGYDQIEVDEFLDEVVATIYSLTVENSELKEKLAASEAQVASLASGGMPVADTTETVVVEEPVVEPEPAPAAPEVVEYAPNDPNAATSMLALAQRLHDEYVNDGREEGERIVADARADGDAIIKSAEGQREKILTSLEEKRAELEKTINDLREFETDYRTSISDHLRKLLEDVEIENDQNK